jgi:hypothetical protein
MNYLLFVYYNDTVENSETSTNEIATRIAEQMTSKEAKFMFGDKHAIFHFASDMTIEEMGGWIDIINDELDCFQYFLTPKPRSSASNMPKDNLDHLLSLKKTKQTKNKPTPPRINYEFKESKDGDSFMDLADILINLKKPQICNMTLDELLDKISFQGIESLTEIEKQKLVEYSNLI